MSNKILPIFLSLGLSLFASACKPKEPLKEPANLSFALDLERQRPGEAKLKFNGGEIKMASLSFSGQRMQGIPVQFERSYPQALTLNFNQSTGLADLDFDIPKGAYESIEVALRSANEPGGLRLEGEYRPDQSGQVFYLDFRLDVLTYFSAIAKDERGAGRDNKVVISGETIAKAKIRFKPIHWFQGVSQGLWQNAQVERIQGKDYIRISASQNTAIYDQVLLRLNQELEVLFNVPQ